MLSSISDFLTVHSPAVLGALVEGTIKGAVVLAMTGLAATAMRHRSAAARHLLWAIALVVVSAMPFAMRVLPAWRVTVPNKVAAFAMRLQPRLSHESPRAVQSRPLIANAVAASSAQRAASASQSTALPLSGPPPRHVESINVPISLESIIVAVWMIVALTMIARLIANLATVARITRRAAVIRDARWLARAAEASDTVGLRREVRLLASGEIKVPMTWGVAHPVVLLTADSNEWSDERSRAVLLHELAHVARFDAATQFFAQLSCAVYWFNPLVWIAVRSLRAERERACDDRVLLAGIRPTHYAGELIDIARGDANAAFAGVALALARRSQLETRVRAILDPRAQRRALQPRSSAIVCLTVLAFALPIAAFRPAAPEIRQIRRAPTAQPAFASATPRDTSPSLRPATRTPAAPHRAPAMLVSPSAANAPVSQPDAPIVFAGQSLCRGAHRPLQHNSGYDGYMAQLNPGFYFLDKLVGGFGKGRWPGTINGILARNWQGDNCSAHYSSEGKITFNDDFTDITGVSAGGFVDISVEANGEERRIKIFPPGARVNHMYFVKGQRMEYDDSARKWVAAFLIDFDHEGAHGVDTRLPVLLKEGGVSAVLDEIDQMTSEYARDVYYMQLIATTALADSDVRRVAASIATTNSTDYGIVRLLFPLADAHPLADPETRATFVEAASYLWFDYDRGRALTRIASSGPLPLSGQLRLLALTREMETDSTVVETLIAFGSHNDLTGSARAFYTNLANRIQSPADRQRVMNALRRGSAP